MCQGCWRAPVESKTDCIWRHVQTSRWRHSWQSQLNLSKFVTLHRASSTYLKLVVAFLMLIVYHVTLMCTSLRLSRVILNMSRLIYSCRMTPPLVDATGLASLPRKLKWLYIYKYIYRAENWDYNFLHRSEFHSSDSQSVCIHSLLFLILSSHLVVTALHPFTLRSCKSCSLNTTLLNYQRTSVHFPQWNV